MFWIVSAYFLTATAVTPLYGKLADIHGRRPVLLAGIGIFVLGSILAALAPTMFWLIVARAIQGIGGGGLIAMAQTVIGDLVPAKERGKFAVYISGTWAIASIAGPILGGLIAEHLHWSVIFWLNLPLAALAVAMTNESLKQAPWQRREHRLDILGAMLVVVATVALMLGLTLGGAGHGWMSLAVLGPLVSAVVLGLIFAWHLQRTPVPLIPLEVLSNPVVRYATTSVFFAMASFIGLVVYIPLYLELVHGFSASEAGLALVGYMIGTVAGANFAARTMPKVTHYRRLPVLGLCLSIAALVVLAAFAGTLPVLGNRGSPHRHRSRQRRAVPSHDGRNAERRRSARHGGCDRRARVPEGARQCGWRRCHWRGRQCGRYRQCFGDACGGWGGQGRVGAARWYGCGLRAGILGLCAVALGLRRTAVAHAGAGVAREEEQRPEAAMVEAR